MIEPCWTADDVDVCESCCSDALDQLDPPVAEALKAWAAWLLWTATGKRYGLCERTYRPCRINCGVSGGLPTPERIGGQWVNVSCGRCRGACGCDFVSEVDIPDVQEVVSLRIDGEDVDPLGAVAVYDRHRIVRLGGQWPGCQNLSDIDGPGTWSITVLQGRPLPPGAATIAGILVCELAKACVGDSGCRLPQRVQTLTRQGVSVGFMDSFEQLDQLRFGLFEVDSWIEMSRSTIMQQPTITSVDRPRASILTWPVIP